MNCKLEITCRIDALKLGRIGPGDLLVVWSMVREPYQHANMPVSTCFSGEIYETCHSILLAPEKFKDSSVSLSTEDKSHVPAYASDFQMVQNSKYSFYGPLIKS